MPTRTEPVARRRAVGRWLCSSGLATLASLLVAPTFASAQSGYGSAPFREQPVAVAQAAALERLQVAAKAFQAQPAGEKTENDEDAEGEEPAEGEEDEAGPLVEFALFRASLAAASPELARSLGDAVDEMLEAAERGEDASEPAGEVVRLSEKARETLMAGGDETPGFQAALMASLLLDEGGVAEGYEEAVEGEGHAYALGWFALQRVKALWGGLAGQATPEQVADVEATLTILDGLFPQQAAPEDLSPDPEQAEAPAHQLVGLLEVVADAELYPGRDLPGAVALVHHLAEHGCAVLATGDLAAGSETLTIAAASHAQTAQATLAVLAPDAGEAIAGHFVALRSAEPGEAAGRCGSLLEALAAGQAALTP